MKLNNRFQRKEKKYLLSQEKYELLLKKVAQHLVQDAYGKHTILSLYYDDCDFSLIRHSIQKPKYKEKFRVRSYGCPQSSTAPIYLEIKKKVNGIVYKRRVKIKYDELALFNRNAKSLAVKVSDQQIKNEIDYLVLRRHLFPQVLICYEREAFYSQDDEEFRVTFDHEIRFRTDDLNLQSGTRGQRVAPEFDVLMEVKALGAYPVWFSQILSELAIFPNSFSKYAQVYVRYLAPNHLLKEEQKYAS